MKWVPLTQGEWDHHRMARHSNSTFPSLTKSWDTKEGIMLWHKAIDENYEKMSLPINVA